MVSHSLQNRANTYHKNNAGTSLILLGSEHVGCHHVTLPKASARQQAAMLQFAIEDQIAAPLETVLIAKAPVKTKSKTDFLVFVVDHAQLNNQPPDAAILPEFLLVPKPQRDHTWAIWRDGPRAVIRKSDGGGFACQIEMLGLLWRKAGKPTLLSYAETLPEGLPCQDHATQPPKPDTADLGFRLDLKKEGGDINIARIGGRLILASVLIALLALGGLWADNWALHAQAERARAQAQATIAPLLPGITVTPEIGGLLARLTPQAPQSEQGPFLPLLADIASQFNAVSQENNTSLRFRRLAWEAGENRLILLVEAPDLGALQRAEQRLQTNGFQVTTGAANARDGGAEVEMRIQRGGG